MTISAPRDNNFIPTAMGTLNSDGITPVLMSITAATHRIKAVNGTTGSDLSSGNAKRDANRVPVMMGVSAIDGVTLIPIYFDSTGAILVRST